GAEDALVVNNNAAAVLLALAVAAGGKQTIVSRGELIEIGGAFRMPAIMASAGTTLLEVGTTNRTHARDYESAIGDDTALLLKVHRSNFAIVGFTTEVEVRELAELAHRKNLVAMVDLGSGALTDLRALGLGDPDRSEPTVPEVVRAGADVVTFSGDKLLGGPQAGVIVGTRVLIAAMRAHPLLRAVRPDKMTLAALEATLELYRDGRASEVPAIAMLATPEPTLEARARRLSQACQEAAPSLQFTPVRVRSAVGGGALPTVEPWSWAVAACARDAGARESGGPSPDALDARLRRATPPVVARIADDRLLLDVRTLGDDDLPAVARAFIGEPSVSEASRLPRGSAERNAR
ncbi:MAG TPA: L-seryl-tRNA(Sec) selenium transferase, partial [Polyangia bacterium]|nr:L-seryl-tRNA(Sec) selenium transferase [Polyangia bacterium]